MKPVTSGEQERKKHMNTVNLHFKKITSLCLILCALDCFGLLSKAQAAPTPNTPDPGSVGGMLSTADGQRAMPFNTGTANSAFGAYSLFSITTGNFNTAVGVAALDLNNGDANTAVGTAALLLNTSGTENTAVGVDALFHNDSTGNGLANNNTAVGARALLGNVDGSENTAVGAETGPNIVTGFNNTYVGDFVGTLAADESNTIRIGDLSNGNGAGSLACFIGGIFNNFQPVGGSVVEVTLDLSNDELGWDIGPNQGGSAPVPRAAPHVPAPPQRQTMLNGKVEKLEATVAQQQKQIETLTTQLKEQAAQIQKVSAQLEVSKAAPQTVLNNQ
jgi:hypothetical protein